MSERLTRRTETGKVRFRDCTVSMRNVIDKLAEYEDLEKQGLLLRLPCKVGDTVYEASRLWKSVMHRTVASIALCNGDRVFIRNGCGDSFEIGVDVFLTQSEAEEKLRKMEAEK